MMDSGCSLVYIFEYSKAKDDSRHAYLLVEVAGEYISVLELPWISDYKKCLVTYIERKKGRGTYAMMDKTL